MTESLAGELERLVVDAWPAAETEELDGWLLRASGGPTNRGNSVATLAAGSALGLEERIARTEQWYRERGRTAVIQVGPAAAPEGLDAALEQRGYRRHGDSVTAIAAPQVVSEHTKSVLRASVESSPNPEWIGIVESSSRHASTHEVLRGFLARLGARCRFVTAWVQEQPAAIGLGITSPGRLGVYAMHTVPELRRRGAARAVLHALAGTALAEGQGELYLLVDAQNTGARSLYTHNGFRDVYHYHYRIQGGG
ncbi:MAG TPA: GNAT family N-acetyltransferase [Polyangiaceae bacterium]|nr:GNAT family N-acetyltransferase [Polyangiaceae bacterium]